MTHEPVIGVLALQGDVREHLRAIAEAGGVGRPVRRPEELEGIDGLIIPGGESTTIGKLAQEFGLMEPVHRFLAAGGAAYGSCAGMIMLASEILDGRPDQRGFGGIDMAVRRNAFGRQVDSFEAPVEIDGVDGGPFRAVFIRAPWVERVGEGVEVLGRVSDGVAPSHAQVRGGAGSAPSHAQVRGGAGSAPSHAQVRGGAGSAPSHAQVRGGAGSAAGRIVAVRQGNLLATAFHPELTGDPRVHRFFVAMAAGRAEGVGGSVRGSARR